MAVEYNYAYFFYNKYLQISEIGLNILNTMLMNISNATGDQRKMFFKTFFMDILQHMFAVITDRSQTGSMSHLNCQNYNMYTCF